MTKVISKNLQNILTKNKYFEYSYEERVKLHEETMKRISNVFTSEEKQDFLSSYSELGQGENNYEP